MLNQYVSAYQIPSVYLNIEIIDPDYDPTSPYVRVFRLLNKSVSNELPKYTYNLISLTGEFSELILVVNSAMSLFLEIKLKKNCGDMFVS